jgi:hypothetical protein
LCQAVALVWLATDNKVNAGLGVREKAENESLFRPLVLFSGFCLLFGGGSGDRIEDRGHKESQGYGVH